MKRYQAEQEREITPQPSTFTAQVVVPLAQCGLVGLMLAVGAMAIARAILGDWRGWPVALLIGLLGFVGLGVWRFVWDVRRPVLEWLESATGQDLDGNGEIGSAGRVTITETQLDRRARQVLRMATEGKSISRRTLVPRMMSRGEWQALMTRLVARGICERARDGSAVLRVKTFAEAWERYTTPRESTQFWVDEDGGLVSKE